jgi:perosamine synthetase
VFSFHGSKTVTTGEGGMLMTDDAALFRRAGVLRDHGRRQGDKNFFNDEVAFKYKMTALQAALGLAQLERIEELTERKRQIFSWYQEELGGVEGITLNAEPPGHRHVFWMVTAIVDPRYGVTKQDLQQVFDRADVDTRPFFHPLSSLPAYRARPGAADAAKRNRVAYRVSATGINLPSALSLDRESVKYVCDTFKAALAARPSHR